VANAKICTCGKQGKITDSRKRQGGYVWRRYGCQCGAKWSSVEIKVSDVPSGNVELAVIDRNCTGRELVKLLAEKLGG
jgi:hypothetical protein